MNPEDLLSLQRQLESARENLRLIQERKAEYVLSVDAPLQLLKEERHWQEIIAELEQAIQNQAITPETRERYLEQIIRYYRDLDFVGIPELKDRQALQLLRVS